MANELKRQIVRDLEITNVQSELEEVDVWQSEEVSRLQVADGAKAGEARGRPRKSMTELRADGAKLIRDKASNIDDSLAKLEALKTQLLEEQSKAFGASWLAGHSWTVCVYPGPCIGIPPCQTLSPI